MSSPTISVSTVIDVYYTLLELGIDKGFLETESGIRLAELENPDGRVCISKLKTLWDIALTYTKNPAIGLVVGEKVDPSRFSIVTQASFQCETAREGLEKYTRFFSIVNQAASLALNIEGDLATLEFQFESPEFYSISEMERTMVSILTRSHYALGHKAIPKKIFFQHAAPDYLDQYETVFQAPLFFDQDKTAIVFDQKWLDTKINQSNPHLLNVLTDYAEKLLKKLQPTRTTQSKLREFIKLNLCNNDNLDVKLAAKKLNMSRHTLYRKLKKEGVSFQSLVEEVRQKEAKSHLKENIISISELAYLLGFSELSAFSRAFKRWTGESPAQFRDHALQTPIADKATTGT